MEFAMLFNERFDTVWDAIDEWRTPWDVIDEWRTSLRK